MAMFQRGGNFFQRRLTQLYADTKQSYEIAKPAPISTNVEDSPEVLALRKEFQIQQDRLLAWGMHWADKNAQHQGYSGADSKGGEKGGMGGDVEIDKKIDQAGLGDTVASVMEDIKCLLDESGRLQHPERWREHQAAKLGGKSAMMKDRFGPTSPKLERKEWKEYEVQTGSALLEQLTNCIDVLYSLVEAHKGEKEGEDSIKSVAQPESGRGFKRKLTVDEMYDNLATEKSPDLDLFHHPLYIDFTRLEPMHDPNASARPPSYDDVRDNAIIQARSIYFYNDMQVHVLVDLVRTRAVPHGNGPDDPLRNMYSLADKLSGKGLLTWDGHLRLLGFTLAAASSRFGLVYALPSPNDPTAIQQYQTLTTTIAATYEHDTSMPPLENKFRLAYYVALLATGYLAHDQTHGQIKPSNLIFLRENDNPRLGDSMRCPYLLQPVQKLVGLSSTQQPLSATIYSHPDTEEAGYGTVAAHDIYSVGLLLLEIGLWMPLTKFWKPKYDSMAFATRLRRQYTPKLASKCGSSYMKLVQKCMDAPEALIDKPSPVDAAEYLLSVVEDLAKCCAIDELGSPSDLDIDVYEALIEEQRRANPQPEKTNVPVIPGAFQTEEVQSPPTNKMTKGKSTHHKKQKSESLLRKWPELDIPQDHLDQWNAMLMPRLSKILKDILRDSLESCSVSLMMIGSTPDKAKTTICVQCCNTSRVRDALCQRFKPKRDWGLVICKGEVRRSGQVRRKQYTARRSGMPHSSENVSRPRKTREQHFQQRPGCGASIGAFKDNEHLPPVSFGGTVLVDGEPFGLTVHHMLDEPSDEEEEDEEEDTEDDPDVVRRSTAPRKNPRIAQMEAEVQFMGSEEDLPTFMDNLDLIGDSSSDDLNNDDDNDIFDLSDSDSDASTIRPDYSILDSDGNEFWFLDDSSTTDSTPDLDDDQLSDLDEEDEDTASIGDKPGYMPCTFDEEDLCITQPAIDDVDDDFFPNMEDRDDDHLSSHSLGYVHASSGIRRVIKDELKHEIDWALIKINDDRLPPLPTTSRPSDPSGTLNNIAARKSSTSSHSSRRPIRRPHPTQPTLITTAPVSTLANTPVTSIGRTSGRRTGRISQTLSLVKFHGRTSFSASYSVSGGFGVPGDSGAWVWNESSKQLCGHVLAWASGLGIAFISPMEVIFEDLKRSLGAECVRLPDQIVSVAQEVVVLDLASDDRFHRAMQGIRESSSSPTPTPMTTQVVKGGQAPAQKKDVYDVGVTSIRTNMQMARIIS